MAHETLSEEETEEAEKQKLRFLRWRDQRDEHWKRVDDQNFRRLVKGCEYSDLGFQIFFSVSFYIAARDSDQARSKNQTP